jgi:hypothetical protein
MDEAIPIELAEPQVVTDGRRQSRLVPALAAAVIATALIIEAILTILHGRANGDLMIMVCPILGSLFLSIPAIQAWWLVLTILRRR